MPGPYRVPVPAEIRLMQEFRFLPLVGMTYHRNDTSNCVTQTPVYLYLQSRNSLAGRGGFVTRPCSGASTVHLWRRRFSEPDLPLRAGRV